VQKSTTIKGINICLTRNLQSVRWTDLKDNSLLRGWFPGPDLAGGMPGAKLAWGSLGGRL